MKRLLNTLYVTTQGAYLNKEGETVVVNVEGERRLQVPVLNLSAIVCFGQVSCSPFLMGLCAERGVTLAFLSEQGRFLARIHGPAHGNVLLRREQYRRSDQEAGAVSIVRGVLAGKIANSRVVLLRALRDRPTQDGGGALKTAADELARQLGEVASGTSLDTLRGIEGLAARTYFGVFDHLITQQRGDFRFQGRSRRPPLDNVNALLSFLYTLVRHDIVGALEGVGLDPAVGFLHRDRPGRPSLALDLLEEFRAYLADRLALSMINLRQLSARDFVRSESGAVSMTEQGRKELLVAYQKRKQEEIVHPFLGEKIALGLVPHVQALMLARHLRGDMEAYPPFVAK